MKDQVSESEWLRVYKTDLGLHYESQLVSDRVSVSPESIASRWDSFTAEERWEVALALQLRGTLEPEIVPLVDFLLEAGDSIIRTTLAPLLPMHPRKKAVVDFLLLQVHAETSHRGNYFQALALIGDVAAVPALTEIYEQMEQRVSTAYETLSMEEAADFIACCEALWKLTGADRFRSSVEKLAKHSNRVVRTLVSAAIGEPK